MTPARWQQIKELVNSVAAEDAATRSAMLQQSCAGDLPLQRGAEALLSLREDPTRRFLNNQSPLAPAEWRRIEQLFQAALELQPAERAAFLAKECGENQALHHEVESLLVYQAAAGDLIGGAIQQAAGLLPNTTETKARFTPGTTLNKRYRIIGLLGKGGMGEVYRADDLKLGHPVALKFLTEKMSQDKAMLARFHSEVSMAHRVTHPNVCRVHDIGEVTTSAGTLHFLTMEYVDGEDLSSLLRRIGRLPADKAVEIANQLCAGLAAAHEAGVLHRDLKPANVMIDGKGRVRITDFGLAGFAEQIRGNEVMAGTPAYMSPEQFAGREVTAQSDLYALGLVLYEVFTGKRVFEAASLQELQRLHESSSPTNPSNWVKDIDPLVERVILRCLEKDPAKRLASAQQVADALPGGDPLAAALALGETPSPEMVAAAGQKTGMKPLSAVLCLVAIIVGIVVGAMMNRRVSFVEKVGLVDSPEVMSGKARAIIAQLGYAETPVDRAYGLRRDTDYLGYLEKSAQAAESARLLASGHTPAIHFWYRESPTPLNAVLRWDENSVSPTDPPEDVSGMRSVLLDPAGRLLKFGAVPSQVEKNPAPGAVPDWKAPFALAGLDLNQFTSAEPEWAPDPWGPCDARAAWTGSYSGQATMPIRIEAAGYHGKLVSFQIIRPYQKAWHAPASIAKGQAALNVVEVVLLFAIIFVATWFVRRNVQNGRADLRGAFRLAMTVFVLGLLGQILLTHSLTILSANFIGLRMGIALFTAVFVGVVYLALEPFIRRKWPHIVISWNRLLAGGLRDPLVGRDLLTGIVMGMLFSLCVKGYDLIGQSFGRHGIVAEALTTLALTTLGSTKLMTFRIVGLLPFSLGFMFAACFTVFLFRLLLRRDWLACLAMVLFVTFYDSLTYPFPEFLLSSLSVTFMLVAITRFGVLSAVAYYFTIATLGSFLITTNLSAWYANSGLFAAGVLVALAIYAFYTSLGGQKVFAGKLLEE